MLVLIELLADLVSIGAGAFALYYGAKGLRDANTSEIEKLETNIEEDDAADEQPRNSED